MEMERILSQKQWGESCNKEATWACIGMRMFKSATKRAALVSMKINSCLLLHYRYSANRSKTGCSAMSAVSHEASAWLFVRQYDTLSSVCRSSEVTAWSALGRIHANAFPGATCGINNRACIFKNIVISKIEKLKPRESGKRCHHYIIPEVLQPIKYIRL